MLVAVLLGVAALVHTAPGAAQIKQPGAHPHYAVELDPHFVIQHSQRPFGSAGIGLGLRAAVPFVHNGPVPQINNNIGISFGIDWVHFGDDDVCRVRGGVPFFPDRCSGANVWLPATAEWSFFFTPVVSVFADVGLALQYEHWSWAGVCNGGTCNTSDSNVDVEFVSWVGGRFLVFGDRAGFTVRLGWPYVALGGAVLF